DAFVRAYVTVFGVLAMAISLFGSVIVDVFAPDEYRVAVQALPALVFAAVCEGLQRASGIGADLAKRTGVWAASSLLTLVLGLSLAALPVPRVGLAGAGIGWVAATAAATWVVYRAAREVSGIVLPVGRSLFVLIVGAAVGTAGAFHPGSAPLRLVVLALFVAL